MGSPARIGAISGRSLTNFASVAATGTCARPLISAQAIDGWAFDDLLMQDGTAAHGRNDPVSLHCRLEKDVERGGDQHE